VAPYIKEISHDIFSLSVHHTGSNYIRY